MPTPRASPAPAPAAPPWPAGGRADASRHQGRALLEHGRRQAVVALGRQRGLTSPTIARRSARSPTATIRAPTGAWVAEHVRRGRLCPGDPLRRLRARWGRLRPDPAAAPPPSAASTRAWPRNSAATRWLPAAASGRPAAASPSWRSASWKGPWKRACGTRPPRARTVQAIATRVVKALEAGLGRSNLPAPRPPGRDPSAHRLVGAAAFLQ